MVPSFFIKMEALPTTLNGKVDRKALKEPDKSKIAHQGVSRKADDCNGTQDEQSLV